MAAFSTDDVFGNRLDFDIARDGFVRGFRDDTAMRDAAAWLRDEGYRVIDVEAGGWEDERQLLSAFAAALSFPSYFGMNLDALNDCLSDVAQGEYGWDARDTGLALALHGFRRFAERLPQTASRVKGILQAQGRYAALFGNRLFTTLS
ncbi:barstar family protein [Curtobacterium sp. MCBD17_040]|uniref:barstar family protein n=1 Tax=Curtobacterium sp. MCBD17_040 TaxID=2175674 RepID=UPI0015E8C8F3|nr:barstar family protein [Curtobacterium sp. MCBD17_040]WIB65810.1 barstar family protein [Curtobacterium sp. MCBD17_040]